MQDVSILIFIFIRKLEPKILCLVSVFLLFIVFLGFSQDLLRVILLISCENLPVRSD